MYGIFTYIYHKIQPNVGKYTNVPWMVWVMESKGLGFFSWLQLEETLLGLQVDR